MTEQKTAHATDPNSVPIVPDLPIPEFLAEGALPGTPSEWIEELQHHRKRVRIIRTSFARSKGSFTAHENTIVKHFDTKNPDDFRCFEVWLDPSDGTQTKIEGAHNATAVVAHVWKSLCQAGALEARKHNLSRMRGNMLLLDQDGEPLNDPSLSHKVLEDADTLSPSVVSEDEEVVKKLALSAAVGRSMNAHLTAMEKIDQSVIMKSQNLETEMQRIQTFGKTHADFIEWQTKIASVHLDRASREAKTDAVMAFASAAIAPKVPMLLDALAVGLRTGFGRVADVSAVPTLPSPIILWLMATMPQQYLEASAATHKDDAKAPTSPGYTAAWLGVIALLDAAVYEHDCTDEGRRMIEAWTKAACKVLSIDHHLFAHATFATHTDAQTAHQERQERQGRQEQENKKKTEDSVNAEPRAPSE